MSVVIRSFFFVGCLGLLCSFNSDTGAVVRGEHPQTELTGLIDQPTIRVLTDTQTLFQYLYDKNDIVIGLSHDVKTIRRNFDKKKQTEGKIEIVTADQEPLGLSATFNLGGKTRRKICRLAPVKINLKKKELGDYQLLKKCDKAKIVFQCSGTKAMAASIKMEKTLYNLYGVLSGYARRAKMIKVKEGEETKELDAFLLEDDSDFGIRTGTEVLKNKTIATHVLNREEYIKMCLFQFMISNADWSARRGHNTDLYRRIADNSLIIVPYDFDYSGIINNSYAVAPENLPITKVTQRYFMDKNVSLEELQRGVAFYIEKEAEVYATLDQSMILSDGSKKRMRKFIEGFYKIIKNKKKVARMVK